MMIAGLVIPSTEGTRFIASAPSGALFEPENRRYDDCEDNSSNNDVLHDTQSPKELTDH